MHEKKTDRKVEPKRAEQNSNRGRTQAGNGRIESMIKKVRQVRRLVDELALLVKSSNTLVHWLIRLILTLGGLIVALRLMTG